MASQEKDDRPTNAIHFFKVILARTLQLGKLRIPVKFVSKYRNHLSDPRSLKLPAGAEWRINLKETENGEVWFQNGWKEFAEHYCLGHGHFLVFKYEGTSTFRVMIFDPSALEIDYLSYDEETEESSDSVEILDEMPLIFLGHDKKRGYNPNGELESNFDELATQTPSFSNKSRVSGSLEAARRFSSKNPFFNITMKLYHNIYGGSMIPIDFARRNMKRNNQKVTLNVGSRSWISKVVHYPKYSYARFTSGWGSFARENNLKDGDACFFELINSDDLMFKVSIFRS